MSVVIKNHESGLTLPPAPGFGLDGLWPPVETEWLPLRWELFELETQELEAMIGWMLFKIASHPISDDAWLKDFYTKPSFAKSSVELMLSKDKASISITSEGSALNLSRSRTSLFGRATLELSDLRNFVLEAFRAKELRQLVHCVRWRRKDPVTQLPPDASHELTHSVTTGLSIEQSQTLTESLGLDLGGNRQDFRQSSVISFKNNLG